MNKVCIGCNRELKVTEFNFYYESICKYCKGELKRLGRNLHNSIVAEGKRAFIRQYTEIAKYFKYKYKGKIKITKLKINKVKYLYRKEFMRNKAIRLKRDDYKCVECGCTKKLHIHHLIYRSKGGTNDLINLITLCLECHKERHRGESAYNLIH